MFNEIMRIPFLAIVLTMMSFSFSSKAGSTPVRADHVASVSPQAKTNQSRENLAYSLGIQAYIYGYTLVEMARTMQKFTENPPLNTFHHDKLLADASFKDFVKPNNDTLYSAAWLDLSKGP